MKLYGEFVPGTDSWLTFSLMKTQQKMSGGHYFPLPTDQRYAINLHFTDYFPGTDRWKMTLRLAYRRENSGKMGISNVWIGLDCLNLFGISNVNSYYWVTDVTNRQWAVPNYLTGRLVNAKVVIDFK